MNSTELDSFLAALGRVLGTPASLDALGCAQVAVDDMVVTLMADDDGEGLIAFIVAGPVAGPQRGLLLRLMLQANHGGALTGGGSLALGGGDAMLMVRWPLHLDESRLAPAVTDFLNAAEYWRSVVATSANDPQATPAAEAAFAVAGSRI